MGILLFVWVVSFDNGGPRSNPLDDLLKRDASFLGENFVLFGIPFEYPHGSIV